MSFSDRLLQLLRIYDNTSPRVMKIVWAIDMRADVGQGRRDATSRGGASGLLFARCLIDSSILASQRTNCGRLCSSCPILVVGCAGSWRTVATWSSQRLFNRMI